jgi:prenyltransferase beta subunit
MRKKLLLGVILFLFTFSSIYGIFIISLEPTQETPSPQSSAIANDFMTELLEDKSLEYGQKGYFSNIYEPSLQATYYGLSILDATGRLDMVQIPAVKNFIMSFYDNNTKLFYDSYAYRAIDITSFERPYPLASLLEINCYAVLSLEILGYIHLIDSPEMLDFTMTCINSTSSGFIGRPYDHDLTEHEKTATADNSFYAIQIVEALSDWSFYPNLKDNLINFLSDLQDYNFGGFMNDEDKSFPSLGYNEPNMASTYYCIKSLEILNDLTGFNNNLFESYMMDLYDNATHSFHYFSSTEDDYDIIATAMGMEIAHIMNIDNISIDRCVSFLKNVRNNYGIWGSTVISSQYELIDTFQVIRSIEGAGKLSQMNYQDFNIMASATFNLYYLTGFSLLSEEYISTKTLYNLVSSYDLYDCVLELLPIGYLTTLLEDTYKYYSVSDYHTFLACGNLVTEKDFRSMPIEYYNQGDHSHVFITDFMKDHKSMYHVLRSLQVISKLEEFQSVCNLTDLIYYIIDCQFILDGYENTGGFLLSTNLRAFSEERQNHSIYLENSYYAVKALQLLAEILDIESFADLGFDEVKFISYIKNKIVEITDEIFFNPSYTDNSEITLEHTYYACEMLTSFSSFGYDIQNIKNYIVNHLDYSNIKNVYYSYRLADLLDIDIYFIEGYIYKLIEKIYSLDFKEFYLSDSRNHIEQEALLWVADLLLNFKNPNIKPVVNYKSILPHAIVFFTIFTIAPGTVFFITKKEASKLNLKNLKKKLKFK